MSPLERLDALKGQFGADAARDVVCLLQELARTSLSTPADLIHLHETTLYLRAYPQNPRVLRLADQILFSFAKRLRDLAPDTLREFEYADISGIAGTGLSTNFSYPFARSLAVRHNASKHAGSSKHPAVAIDWDHYPHSDRLGPILARLIPDSFEDWAIAPHPDWRRWFEAAGGTPQWLIQNVTPEVYDLLEIPLRWEIGASAASRSASRSAARIPTRQIFYHSEPFLTRKDVSIAAEFAAPPIRATRLTRAEAENILAIITDASAVRYRELYGFLYPDLAHVYRADLGRGVEIFFFGVSPEWKLPHREYCAGMYFKNGVPIGYVEVMWTSDRTNKAQTKKGLSAMSASAMEESRIGARAMEEGRMEVGFNLYYTFRQGETAWLYARLLKLFGQRFQVRSFFIDPYQIGHENEEAIESGAFWFYRKLGFRSESPATQKRIDREEQKISASRQSQAKSSSATGSSAKGSSEKRSAEKRSPENKSSQNLTPYRTPPRILRKLASARLILNVP